jgi:hypothetical protein
MIELAENLAADMGIVVPGNGYNYDASYLAEKFLEVFEKLGMLPPMKSDGCPFEMTSKDYEWEAEDE